jgi:hypothetical protein
LRRNWRQGYFQFSLCHMASKAVKNHPTRNRMGTS